MTVEIIRHGLTALQAERRYQGKTDVSLSPEGRGKLRSCESIPDLLCVSGLLRARETADILFPSVPQMTVRGLEEMDFGVFEGKSADEMENFRLYRDWVDGGCSGQCPGGESREQFRARTCSAFEGLMKQAEAQKIRSLVIVAHGGTQMAVMERFALPERSYFDWHLESGRGYLCDCGTWKNEHKIQLLKITDYNRS